MFEIVSSERLVPTKEHALILDCHYIASALLESLLPELPTRMFPESSLLMRVILLHVLEFFLITETKQIFVRNNRLSGRAPCCLSIKQNSSRIERSSYVCILSEELHTLQHKMTEIDNMVTLRSITQLSKTHNMLLLTM